MKGKIIQYLKHIGITILLLLIIGVSIILFLNGNVHYSDNSAKKNWIKEGPYLFYKNDSTYEVNYITGNRALGFEPTKSTHLINDEIKLASHFNLDSSLFGFTINPAIEIPKSTYMDDHKIIAISDIESGYRTFRDFLINNKVINEKLEWSFGNGHLVLVGDFVDRGYTTTQVLWFIYKLEQDAMAHGGMVHYILGNHEIKNLQGNYTKASLKYFYAAAMLEKQQYELYDSRSFLGRWMESKNSIELINNHLFVHGGIHPKLSDYDTDIDQVNEIVRGKYRQAYFPTNEHNLQDLLTSTTKGPSWYRGYFNDDLSEDEINKGLQLFNAKDVIVGHTIQRKVKKMHNGKVFSLDVNHPKDYRKSWPHKSSEGLLIENGNYYRVLHNGKKEKL
jgi:hypothetical protein